MHIKFMIKQNTCPTNFLIVISTALSLCVSFIISIVYHALFMNLRINLNIILTITHISSGFAISIYDNIYISLCTCTFTTTRTCKTLLEYQMGGGRLYLIL